MSENGRFRTDATAFYRTACLLTRHLFVTPVRNLVGDDRIRTGFRTVGGKNAGWLRARFDCRSEPSDARGCASSRRLREAVPGNDQQRTEGPAAARRSA